MSDKPEKELAWGETPWDDMSREELLRTVQKFYGAIMAAEGVISNMQMSEAWADVREWMTTEDVQRVIHDHANASPYWGKNGRGGRASEMLRQSLELDANYGDTLYRSFYRYAHDLLFDNSAIRIGFGWSVCSECGSMVGASIDRESENGKPCKGVYGKPDCAGVFRPIQWSDLQKKEEALQ